MTLREVAKEWLDGVFGRFADSQAYDHEIDNLTALLEKVHADGARQAFLPVVVDNSPTAPASTPGD